jgi:hypothetical protein
MKIKKVKDLVLVKEYDSNDKSKTLSFLVPKEDDDILNAPYGQKNKIKTSGTSYFLQSQEVYYLITKQFDTQSYKVIGSLINYEKTFIDGLKEQEVSSLPKWAQKKVFELLMDV